MLAARVGRVSSGRMGWHGCSNYAPEVREWDDEQARQMSANLRPLEDAAVERLKAWKNSPVG
jgi:hypothetical protein